MKMSKYRAFVIETILFGTIILMVVIGPIVVSGDPAFQDLSKAREPPSVNAILGYDELGRDVFVRLVHGARYTVGIGVATVFLSFGAGTFLGAISGFFGRVFDIVIMRAVDIMLAFPNMLLAIVITAIFGIGLVNVVIAATVSAIPIFARLARALTLQVREELFVEAALATGVPTSRIIIKHILPNILLTLIVQVTYSLGDSILTVAALGFLGLGVQPPLPEWGAMLTRAREVMFVAPHIAVSPGLALVFLLLIVNLLGDSLRDILDPRLRRSAT